MTAADVAASGGRQEPVTVFVASWGRPLYLWACLDALYRHTRSAARIVLLDNAHPDPLVGDVIAGFERRGLFAEVVRFPTNSLENIRRGYRERLAGIGPLHVYLESDCVIGERHGCWLAEMRRIMEANPRLGVLGSLIDPIDFVPVDKAVALTGGEHATFLAKLASPERAFLGAGEWADTTRDFFLTEPPCPIHNPPGRLMMLRTAVMQDLGFQLDAPLAALLRDRGLQPAVTARVRHRHLSLLNIYDYAAYDEIHRHGFFSPSASGDA
jgi:GT2 family glycosyltransferase